jgi:hypothetical protein
MVSRQMDGDYGAAGTYTSITAMDGNPYKSPETRLEPPRADAALNAYDFEARFIGWFANLIAVAMLLRWVASLFG